MLRASGADSPKRMQTYSESRTHERSAVTVCDGGKKNRKIKTATEKEREREKQTETDVLK